MDPIYQFWNSFIGTTNCSISISYPFQILLLSNYPILLFHQLWFSTKIIQLKFEFLVFFVVINETSHSFIHTTSTCNQNSNTKDNNDNTLLIFPFYDFNQIVVSKELSRNTKNTTNNCILQINRPINRVLKQTATSSYHTHHTHSIISHNHRQIKYIHHDRTYNYSSSNSKHTWKEPRQQTDHYYL